MPRTKNTVRKVGQRVVMLGDSAAKKKPGRGRPLPDAAYLDAPQLLARFGGRSHMWLVRLLKRDKTFPKPLRVGRLRFFKIVELEAWERETAAKSHAA